MTEPNSESQKKTIDAEHWLEAYGDILYRYSFRYVKDKQTAEDLVSETLLAGLKAQSSFAGQSTEQTWLIGILNNKIMDHFRKTQDPIREPGNQITVPPNGWLILPILWNSKNFGFISMDVLRRWI